MANNNELPDGWGKSDDDLSSPWNNETNEIESVKPEYITSLQESNDNSTSNIKYNNVSQEHASDISSEYNTTIVVKKAPDVKFIIISIVAVLFLGIAITFAFLFFNSKKSHEPREEENLSLMNKVAVTTASDIVTSVTVSETESDLPQTSVIESEIPVSIEKTVVITESELTSEPNTQLSASETEAVHVSPLSYSELGKMYNLFYFRRIMFGFCPGCLADVDNDGTEEFLWQGSSTEFYAYKYENGELNTFSYMPDDNLLNRYTKDEFTSECRKKAAEYGFDFNYNFTNNSNLIGYVDTEGGNLNVRNSPSLNSDIITEIPYGLFFDIISCYDTYGNSVSEFEENIQWYYISVVYNENNIYGYVSADYVRMVNLSI